MIYQLVWVDYGIEDRFSVIGDLDSVYEVWRTCICNGTKWSKTELWQLGPVTMEIPKDGIVVAWWK